MVGRRSFTAFVKQKYRRLHSGKVIPQDPPHHRFSAVYRKSVTLALIITISLLAAFVAVLISDMSHHGVENTAKSELSFVSFVRKDNSVVLTSADGTVFETGYVADVMRDSRLASYCDGMTRLTAYHNLKPGEDGSYILWSLEYDGTVLLSFEETDTLYKQNNAWITYCVGIAWGLSLVCFIVAVIVGRKPEKFPRRMAEFFTRLGRY